MGQRQYDVMDIFHHLRKVGNRALHDASVRMQTHFKP